MASLSFRYWRIESALYPTLTAPGKLVSIPLPNVFPHSPGFCMRSFQCRTSFNKIVLKAGSVLGPATPPGSMSPCIATRFNPEGRTSLFCGPSSMLFKLSRPSTSPTGNLLKCVRILRHLFTLFASTLRKLLTSMIPLNNILTRPKESVELKSPNLSLHIPLLRWLGITSLKWSI